MKNYIYNFFKKIFLKKNNIKKLKASNDLQSIPLLKHPNFNNLNIDEYMFNCY
jgi:hypothetical protein